MQAINANARIFFIVLGVLLISFFVYWPGLSGGYVFDDFGNLVNNHAFAKEALAHHFWTAIWSSDSSRLHRPISMFSFALQMRFTGLDPWSLKLGNVLIHLLNGCLIFLLSSRVLSWLALHLVEREWLLTPKTVALLVTAAWVLAPIQLTAVLYVIQRMESLAALFVLSGLLIWWQGRVRLIEGRAYAWVWIWGGLIGGTVLATLSKETGVMLPVYAFLIDWLVLRFVGRSNVVDRRLYGVFALLLFIPGVLGLAWVLPGILSGSSYAARNFDLGQRLWTEGRVLIDYIHWIILPTPNALSLYHDDIDISHGWFQPWTTVVGWSAIFMLLSAALLWRRRFPVFSLGVIWFFAGHILVSTVVPLELVYEHRNYLPDWGVFLALFGALAGLRPSGAERLRLVRILVLGCSVGLIVLYGVFTAIRANVWAHPYRLAYFEATTHPHSPRANYDLARVMMVTARGVGSPQYQLGLQLMEQTAALPGASLQPLQALIFMAAKNGQPADPAWWQEIRDRIQAQPISAEDVGALYSLLQCQLDGVCHYAPKEIKELGETLDAAMRRYPKRSEVITLVANMAANVTHNYSRAYRLMLRAVALDPSRFQYWKNLMVMQMAAGRWDEASWVLERMRELNFLGTKDATIARLAKQLANKQSAEAPAGGLKGKSG